MVTQRGTTSLTAILLRVTTSARGLRGRALLILLLLRLRHLSWLRLAALSLRRKSTSRYVLLLLHPPLRQLQLYVAALRQRGLHCQDLLLLLLQLLRCQPDSVAQAVGVQLRLSSCSVLKCCYGRRVELWHVAVVDVGLLHLLGLLLLLLLA